MFLLMLGGSLVFGAGLLAAASFSEGTLLALKTAAQIIGWLFLLATVVGVAGLQRGAFGRLGAASVTFVSGLALLYMSYFQWATIPEAPPIRYAVAEPLPVPVRPAAYEVVDFSPKLIPPEPVARLEPVARPRKIVSPAPVATNACSSLKGLESLQCQRCSEKLGVAWIVCQESVRLEYCEQTQGAEGLCPSAIPSANLDSPPG
jgi:hypothetical protein